MATEVEGAGARNERAGARPTEMPPPPKAVPQSSDVPPLAAAVKVPANPWNNYQHILTGIKMSRTEAKEIYIIAQAKRKTEFELRLGEKGANVNQIQRAYAAASREIAPSLSTSSSTPIPPPPTATHTLERPGHAERVRSQVEGARGRGLQIGDDYQPGCGMAGCSWPESSPVSWPGEC